MCWNIIETLCTVLCIMTCCQFHFIGLMALATVNRNSLDAGCLIDAELWIHALTRLKLLGFLDSKDLRRNFGGF